VIDTHCHLTFPDFQEPAYTGGTAAVLRKAAESGVTGCITVSTTPPDAAEALSVAVRFPNVWCSAGVHPLYSDEGPHDWGLLRRVAAHERCIAWGELGLDNHYKEPARATQDAVLEHHLALIESCRREGLDKPIIIHCREAFDDVLPVLRRSTLDPARFVFHCFTGTPDDARKVLDFGACVSFTGVVTYKNASGVAEAARLVPADRIMVETDAPYLSPDPHRGVRPCEPWMASVTALRLAQIRGVAWDEFHAQINANAARFFGVS